MSHWSGSRPLASALPSILDSHWDSSQIPCDCPESWRSCGYDSVGLAPSCPLAAHRWGRCLGQLKTLDLGLSGSWVGQPVYLLALLPLAVKVMVNSSVPMSLGPVLPHPQHCLWCCMVADKEWSQLSHGWWRAGPVQHSTMTSMASGGSPDHRHQNGPWWLHGHRHQHRPWTR